MTDDRMRPARRSVLTGIAAAGVASALPAGAATLAEAPDLGPDVLIVDPAMPRAAVQARLDAIFRRSERAEFGTQRQAVLFKPGRYALDVNVGFYTQVAGLGALPGDVVINGHVHCEADWNRGMALVNFWREVENLSVRPPDSQDRWAVSQAAPYRRVHLAGDLVLDDGGWSSGGFLADCRIDGMVRSGTQQQWFTRASTIGGWRGANWNMVFAGVAGAPATSFPQPPYTTLSDVPAIREKPFLQIEAGGRWSVFRPAFRRNARGPSWTSGVPAGTTIPLAQFFIARPGMSAAAINAGLARHGHLLLTPGSYPLDAPIRVARAGTVVLGLGFPTLRPERGTAAIEVADVSGVTLAGLLVEAGSTRSPVLVEIGPRGAAGDHRADPTVLSDLFFRVGGAVAGKVDTCLVINSHHVIGDHLWIWRADHGAHVGWEDNAADHGVIVNGDDVTMLGLFVEHFRRYQTLWNGERGRTIFYQCELPYDPPSQAAYMAGATRGWAAYKVADHVTDHHATGLGIYANFTADPSIVLDSAIEAPRGAGVRFSSVTTISLGKGQGTIAHLVNDAGAAARPGAIRQTLVAYP